MPSQVLGKPCGHLIIGNCPTPDHQKQQPISLVPNRSESLRGGTRPDLLNQITNASGHGIPGNPQLSTFQAWLVAVTQVLTRFLSASGCSLFPGEEENRCGLTEGFQEFLVCRPELKLVL